MHKLFQSLLLGGALALMAVIGHAADRNRDVSVSVGGVDVSVGLGGRKGLKANVDASLGGKKGLNADVDATISGKNNLNAGVDVSLGGKKGLDADVDVSLGGKKGLNAGLKAGIGDGVSVDIDLGVDDANAVTPPGVDPGTDPGTDPGGSLTTAQRQAFNGLSGGERKALLKRCNSVGAGGYDPALVQLCKLLRMSASR